MRIAIIKDDGTIVDSYEGVVADDLASSSIWCKSIMDWMLKTMRNAETAEERQQRKDEEAEAEAADEREERAAIAKGLDINGRPLSNSARIHLINEGYDVGNQ